MNLYDHEARRLFARERADGLAKEMQAARFAARLLPGLRARARSARGHGEPKRTRRPLVSGASQGAAESRAL